MLHGPHVSAVPCTRHPDTHPAAHPYTHPRGPNHTERPPLLSYYTTSPVSRHLTASLHTAARSSVKPNTAPLSIPATTACANRTDRGHKRTTRDARPLLRALICASTSCRQALATPSPATRVHALAKESDPGGRAPQRPTEPHPAPDATFSSRFADVLRRCPQGWSLRAGVVIRKK